MLLMSHFEYLYSVHSLTNYCNPVIYFFTVTFFLLNLHVILKVINPLLFIDIYLSSEIYYFICDLVTITFPFNLKSPINIVSKEILVEMNSFNFCLSRKGFTSCSILNDYFAR